MTLRACMLLALLCGCKREPVIVIKFDPYDLSGKPTAPTSDGGEVKSGEAPKGEALKGEPAKAEAAKAEEPKAADVACNKASDCVAAPVECCDCTHGGQLHAENKVAAATHAKKCKEIMCTAMISNDPSCKAKVDCKDSRCILVP